MLLTTNSFTWDDILKKEYLLEALDTNLHMCTVTLSSGLGYTMYCDAVADATDQLECVHPAHVKNNPPSQVNPQGGFQQPPNHQPLFAAIATAPAPPQDPNVMDWEPTSASSITHTKWVTKEEQDRHKHKHLCICCGGSGHFM